MSISTIIEKIIKSISLTDAEAHMLLHKIIVGEINKGLSAGVLFGLQMKGINYEELRGFKKAMMEHCVTPDLPKQAIDLCGTGGDSKNTINISTIASLILSSMHYPVIKHGNHSVASTTGSSQILELAGYNFSNDKNLLTLQFEKFGYCFLHAPLFHKNLAKLAPIRKQLGFRTIFNILGPLCNPADPQYRLHGTSTIALARLYANFFDTQNYQFAVYHTLDGHDEISLTTQTLLFSRTGKYFINPIAQGLDLVNEQTIRNANTPQEALAQFFRIIEGQGTVEQNKVLAYNTAFAIQLYKEKLGAPIQGIYEECFEHLLSGKVRQHLNNIIQFQQQYLSR